MKSFKELLGGLEEARMFASYQDAAAAAGPGQKPKLDAASNKYVLVREETISEAQVSTKKYSWGTMKTIHHGSDFSIPLHPEHHKEIAKLKDEQEHKFKTEDGKHWTARRKGEDVHFQGANNGGTTKVPHSTMKEEVEELEELSKTTLKSYTNDAALDAVRLGNTLGRAQLGKSKAAAGPVGDKITKRLSGIRKATDKMTKEEVTLDEKVYQNKTTGETFGTPDKPATKPATPAAKKPASSLEKLRARMDAARKVNEGRSDVVIHTTASSMDANDQHITKLKDAGIFAQQGSGASHHIIVPREHEDNARKILAGHLKEAMNRQARERAAEEQARRERVLKDNPKIAAEVERRKAAEAAKAKTVKEEVLDEANHREFASQGKMHPDMAKHMSVGQEMDYYEPKTGDKVSGKVMHKSDKEVHMKQTHDSYDPKKKGTVHKFKVSSALDEQSDADLDSMIFEVLGKDAAAAEWIHDFIHSDDPKFAGKTKEKRKQMALAAYYSKQRNEQAPVAPVPDKKYIKGTPEHKAYKATKKPINGMPTNCEEVQKVDIPAYLRKAKGDKPLELKDLKRKDTISDAENLAKNRGVKEQQEGNMKSYKEFVTEIKMSDLPRRSIKGSSYGAQYDDPEGADDADNKKPAKAADAPKRGRGRPAGSTSGARQQGSAKQSKTGGADYTGYKVHLPNSNK